MIREDVPILLPQAIDLGNLRVSARRFSLRVFAHRANYFALSRLTEISYAPVWARVQVYYLMSGVEQAIYGGDNGIVPLDNIDVSHTEPVELALYNWSIDTDVRLTLRFRGWQFGEG